MCAPLLLSSNFSSWWRVTFFSIFSCLIIFDYLLHIVLKRTAATGINVTSPRRTHPLLLGKWGADHFGDQVKAIFILKTAANKHQPTKQKRHKAPDLLSGFPFPAWLVLLWLFLWLKSLVWPWPWSLGSWPSAWSPSWPQALLPTFTSHSCLPPPSPTPLFQASSLCECCPWLVSLFP